MEKLVFCGKWSDELIDVLFEIIILSYLLQRIESLCSRIGNL